MKHFKQTFHLFKPYILKKKWILLFLIILVISEALSGRLIPLLFGYAIDHTIKKPNISLLTFIAFLYLFLSFLKIILRFFTSYFSEKTANDVTYSLQKRIIRYIQKLPLPYFEKNHSGSLITKLVVDTNRVRLIFSEVVQIILTGVIEIISIFLALIYLSPQLTFFTFILTPPVYFITVYINRKIGERFLDAKKVLSKLNFFTIESLNGIRVFDGFNYLKKRKFRFFQISASLFRKQMKLVKGFASLWPLFNFFNATTMGISLFLSYTFFKSWGLTIGQISAYILLLEGFFSPLEKILERYLHFQDSFSSVLRLQDILKQTEESHRGQKRFKRFRGKISFENVFFKYPQSKDWILKNINCVIEAGEKIALIGKTGSGKTTFVELLQKFYEPQKGVIKIDDIPLADLHTEEVRSHIGYIQQDVFLFKGSVLDNITLHNQQKRDFLKLFDQDKKTLIETLLTKINSLDHVIEESGNNLSAGEKQFIEILRFLIYDPQVAVLDESLSYLDHQTAKEIREILFKFSKKRTFLQIAHRIQSFKEFDQIFVLDKGLLIEKGSHNELMGQKKAYFNIVNQFSRFVDKV